MNGDSLPEDPVLVSYFEHLLHPEEFTAPDLNIRPQVPEGPVWTREKFQVRRVWLGKLGFAVLEEHLVGTFALEGEIARRPDQPRWAVGQVHAQGRQLWAVSLAELVLPRSISTPGNTSTDPAWGVLPRKSELILLCHQVEAPGWWTSDNVRWRKERSSRPWLLGMQGDPPCPLIDLDCLVQDLRLNETEEK